MNRKSVILIVFLVIISCVIVLMAAYGNDLDGADQTTLYVYAESFPIPVDKMVNEIETHPYFKNSNNTTVQWLKSQNGVILPSKDYYVLMSANDAGKLPTESATDVIIKDNFKCHIKEKRPLGNGLDDILFVDNVEYLNQDIENLQ